MKVTLYQVIHRKTGMLDAFCTVWKHNPDGGAGAPLVYATAEVDVFEDLTQEQIDDFLAKVDGADNQSRIAELEEELARLRAQE